MYSHKEVPMPEKIGKLNKLGRFVSALEEKAIQLSDYERKGMLTKDEKVRLEFEMEKREIEKDFREVFEREDMSPTGAEIFESDKE